MSSNSSGVFESILLRPTACTTIEVEERLLPAVSQSYSLKYRKIKISRWACVQADMVVVKGNPSRNISDVRNVEIVFRNGTGYSPAKLLAGIDGVGGLDD